jgi:hypothetical protein
MARPNPAALPAKLPKFVAGQDAIDHDTVPLRARPDLMVALAQLRCNAVEPEAFKP